MATTKRAALTLTPEQLAALEAGETYEVVIRPAGSGSGAGIASFTANRSVDEIELTLTMTEGAPFAATIAEAVPASGETPGTAGALSGDGATALAALPAQLEALGSAITGKADKVGGFVPDEQIPPSIARDAEMASAIAAAVAALVGSVPATLDTIDELAAALGDDPNFVTTITGLIGGKQVASAILSALAGLAPVNHRVPYFTGANTMALATFTPSGRQVVAAADMPAMRAAMEITPANIGAVEALVANAKLWFGTQTAYNALGVYGAATLYVITGP